MRRKRRNPGQLMILANKSRKKHRRNPMEYECSSCGWTGEEEELSKGDRCPKCQSHNIFAVSIANPGLPKKWIKQLRKKYPRMTAKEARDIEKDILKKARHNPGKDWKKYKGRPPKEWFSYVVKEIKKRRPRVKDPSALAGWLWYHQMKPETREKVLIAVKAGRSAGIIRKLSAGMIVRGKVIRVAANKRRHKRNPFMRSCKRLPNPKLRIKGIPGKITPVLSRELSEAFRLYKKRHGVNPVSITRVKVPSGYPKVGVPMGNVPEIMYKTAKHINPKAKVPDQMYRHKFEGKTVLVTNPRGKGLYIVPSKSRTYKRWITG